MIQSPYYFKCLSILLSCFVLSLAGCGGGDGGSNNPQGQQILKEKSMSFVPNTGDMEIMYDGKRFRCSNGAMPSERVFVDYQGPLKNKIEFNYTKKLGHGAKKEEIIGYAIRPKLAPGLVFDYQNGTLKGLPKNKINATYQVYQFFNKKVGDNEYLCFVNEARVSAESIQQKPIYQYRSADFQELTYGPGKPIHLDFYGDKRVPVNSFEILDETSLPTGLKFDKQKGIITGIPLIPDDPEVLGKVTRQGGLRGFNTYNVKIKATNDFGSSETDTDFYFKFPKIPQVRYRPTAVRITTEDVIKLVPNIISEQYDTWAKVERYSINPKLPEGLAFNSMTGKITGSPIKGNAKSKWDRAVTYEISAHLKGYTQVKSTGPIFLHILDDKKDDPVYEQKKKEVFNTFSDSVSTYNKDYGYSQGDQHYLEFNSRMMDVHTVSLALEHNYEPTIGKLLKNCSTLDHLKSKTQEKSTKKYLDECYFKYSSKSFRKFVVAQNALAELVDYNLKNAYKESSRFHPVEVGYLNQKPLFLMAEKQMGSMPPVIINSYSVFSDFKLKQTETASTLIEQDISFHFDGMNRRGIELIKTEKDASGLPYAKIYHKWIFDRYKTKEGMYKTIVEEGKDIGGMISLTHFGEDEKTEIANTHTLKNYKEGKFQHMAEMKPHVSVSVNWKNTEDEVSYISTDYDEWKEIRVRPYSKLDQLTYVFSPKTSHKTLTQLFKEDEGLSYGEAHFLHPLRLLQRLQGTNYKDETKGPRDDGKPKVKYHPRSYGFGLRDYSGYEKKFHYDLLDNLLSFTRELKRQCKPSHCVKFDVTIMEDFSLLGTVYHQDPKDETKLIAKNQYYGKAKRERDEFGGEDFEILVFVRTYGQPKFRFYSKLWLGYTQIRSKAFDTEGNFLIGYSVTSQEISKIYKWEYDEKNKKWKFELDGEPTTWSKKTILETSGIIGEIGKAVQAIGETTVQLTGSIVAVTLAHSPLYLGMAWVTGGDVKEAHKDMLERAKENFIRNKVSYLIGGNFFGKKYFESLDVMNLDAVRNIQNVHEELKERPILAAILKGGVDFSNDVVLSIASTKGLEMLSQVGPKLALAVNAYERFGDVSATLEIAETVSSLTLNAVHYHRSESARLLFYKDLQKLTTQGIKLGGKFGSKDN